MISWINIIYFQFELINKISKRSIFLAIFNQYK